METYDWDLIRARLVAARDAGEASWLRVTADARGYGLSQRIREGRIPTIADLDVEVRVRAVKRDSHAHPGGFDVYARIKRGDE